VILDLPDEGPMMLTADACYTMDHYNEKALPGLIHSAADVADSTRKVRRTVEGLDATLVTGHDPEEWPKFKKAPEYYT
jgi:glyoxylase-like metal-dependent hydrolase (beta-lactamase superfamily II)